MSETTPTPGGFVRADDRQISGSHYKTMTVQPWTAMEALLSREEFIGFLKGSIVKYSMRQGRKDGSDDGQKALHYIQKLGEVVGGPGVATLAEWKREQLANLEGWCNGK